MRYKGVRAIVILRCTGAWSQFIPFDQSIVGLTLRAQALMVDATAAGQLTLRVTNGLRITIGG